MLSQNSLDLILLPLFPARVYADSRLARMSAIPFPKRLSWLPWALCSGYGLTTPIASTYPFYLICVFVKNSSDLVQNHTPRGICLNGLSQLLFEAGASCQTITSRLVFIIQ